MVEPSGAEPEPTGWALFRTLVREFIHDMRHPTPRTMRYIGCDRCGQVTAHSSDRRIISIQMSIGEMTAPPPEAVCDECGHAQPRTAGEEVPAEVTVTCAGRRRRRFGHKRSRRRCGRMFEVPAAAPVVACPWCSTVQPGPRTR